MSFRLERLLRLRAREVEQVRVRLATIERERFLEEENIERWRLRAKDGAFALGQRLRAGCTAGAGEEAARAVGCALDESDQSRQRAAQHGTRAEAVRKELALARSKLLGLERLRERYQEAKKRSRARKQMQLLDEVSVRVFGAGPEGKPGRGAR